MKMSQTSTNVIVWEWMNEFGRWRPYEPNVTQFIETNYQNNTNQVNLGPADNSLSSYSIDFITTCQIRLGTGTARPVRRSTYPQSSPPGKGIIWQWEGDVKGQWHGYDMEIACLLENFHSQKQSGQNPMSSYILDLSKSTLKIPYQINFANRTQIRLETGRVRKIRRVTLKQAYPSGNGSSSSPAVTAISNHGSSNGSGLQVQKSPKKQSEGTSVSPAKKFKSSHTAPSSNVNPNIVTPSTGVFNFGNVSINQNSVPNTNQAALPHNRPITRSYINASAASSNAAMIPNQLPYSQLGQSSSIYSNFPPNITINSSNQYGMQTVGMPSSISGMPSSISGMPSSISGMPSSISGMPSSIGGMHTNFSAMQSSVINPGSSNHGYYGGTSMATPFGMFHQGLPGGSIMNMTQNSGLHLTQNPAMMNPSIPRVANSGQSAGSDHLDIPEEAKVPNNVPKQSKKQGKTSDTEIFEQFTEVIQHPPEGEDCCICCEKLNHGSGYGEGQVENHVVYQLNKCRHMFHKLCLIAMYDSGSKNGSMQCPTCKTIYGEKHGNCPKGVLEYFRLPQPLPGYPDCQTVRITYHISPGVQGQEHPHPGKRFSCRGFPRICFLPDNNEGRKILKLLIVAWKRRLTFTIGQSTTTGESDTVTWNEIHHKTELGSNISGHGFPDDKYFENVLQELSVQGVTEKDI